jgi:hypothetical protein
MQEVRGWQVVRQGLGILVLVSVVAGCGGSGSAGSGTGSVTASSGGTSTSDATTLFTQPQEVGIAGKLAVPPATHTAVPVGTFTLVLWQPNPFQAQGLLVPTGWDAGSQTGFTPSNPSTAQLGFQDLPGTSTAQMEGDTVGAYINSQDLSPSTTDQKMMITPEFMFPSGSQPIPFASAQTVLHGALDLQVPTAVGSDVYVNADLLFEDPSGVRISISASIFRNGGAAEVAGTGYDSPSNTYMLNSPLGVDQRFITQASTSASATGTTWSGFRHFEWSMSEAQFVSALQYLVAAFPGQVTSTDPSQYVLTEVHLNAEFHTQGQPAELGWSMRRLNLWTTP